MIFDTLSSSTAIVGEADFTASSAVLEVAVNTPGAMELPFENANLDTWIEPGDNLKLMELTINVPFCFGQGTGTHLIGIAFRDSLGAIIPIPELAGASSVVMPTLCGLTFETPVHIETPKNLGRLELVLVFAGLNLSMVDLPAALDGQTFHVQYHLEVIHTLPLAAVP